MSIFLQTLNGLVFTCNLVTNRKVIKCANIWVITIKFHSLITPFLHFCLLIDPLFCLIETCVILLCFLTDLAMSGGKGPIFLSRMAQSPPSTYSMTMQRCFLVSKEQYMETTKGLSVKHMISRSANTWSTCNEMTGKSNALRPLKQAQNFLNVHRRKNIKYT